MENWSRLPIHMQYVFWAFVGIALNAINEQEAKIDPDKNDEVTGILSQKMVRFLVPFLPILVMHAIMVMQ